MIYRHNLLFDSKMLYDVFSGFFEFTLHEAEVLVKTKSVICSRRENVARIERETEWNIEGGE
jgi:hypothetical protein